MKRSEMVELIQNEFNLVEGMAEEILALLEKNGMMAPLREKIENGRFVGTSNVNHPSWEEE
jgi:hypothetical protein